MEEGRGKNVMRDKEREDKILEEKRRDLNRKGDSGGEKMGY